MITLPLSFSPQSGVLSGATWGEVAPFYPRDPIRQIERASIRAFMEKHRQYLRGRVLDFGAGGQPYRDLVAGEYVAFERGDAQASGIFDAVMCNQVLQYIEAPRAAIGIMRSLLRPGGRLLLTFPTNWDVVEYEDLWRFTQEGMTKLLQADFLCIYEKRAEVVIGNFHFPLGYGVVGEKR